jgi:enterobactin synthetase component D / holo-[acyl-carrier protein] synthase
MSRLGYPPSAILPRDDGPTWARRAPRWPLGLVGSLTHTDGFFGAALAYGTRVSAIGIDAEANAPLPAEVVDLVLREEERRVVAALTRTSPDIAWDRLAFSAKESVYKAWYPGTGKWLDFADCVLQIDSARRRFEADIDVSHRTDPSPRTFTGRWHADAEHLVTAVVVPSRS